MPTSKEIILVLLTDLRQGRSPTCPYSVSSVLGSPRRDKVLRTVGTQDGHNKLADSGHSGNLEGAQLLSLPKEIHYNVGPCTQNQRRGNILV